MFLKRFQSGAHTAFQIRSSLLNCVLNSLVPWHVGRVGGCGTSVGGLLWPLSLLVTHMSKGTQGTSMCAQVTLWAYHPGQAVIIKYAILKQQTLIFSVLEAESQRSKCREGVFLARPLSLTCRWPSPHCVRTRVLCASLPFLIRTPVIGRKPHPYGLI